MAKKRLLIGSVGAGLSGLLWLAWGMAGLAQEPVEPPVPAAEEVAGEPEGPAIPADEKPGAKPEPARASPARQAAARACLEQARTLFREQDYEGARLLLDVTLALDDQLLEAHFWLGRLALAQDELEEAARAFKRVLAQRPDAVDTLYQIGQVLEAKERSDEARVVYQQVQRLDPQHALAREALARLGPSTVKPPPTLEEALANAEKVFPPERLKRLLRKRKPVTIAALGDSLTWGMGVEQQEQNAFPVLFARMVAERFADPQVRLISAGVPGETASSGLQRVERDVLAHQPDLVIVQYGGNDSFQGVPAVEYQDHLRQIVQRVREKSRAAVILVAPPMDRPETDSLFPRSARAVGEELGVPVADFDTALKSQGLDRRGIFPAGEHPQAYSHAIMAQEVDRAFRQLLQLPAPFTASLATGARYARLGEEWPVAVRLRSEMGEPQDVTLTLTLDDAPQSRLAHARPGPDPHEETFPFTLPRQLPGGRAERHRLWLAARNEAGAAFDLKWLTIVPVLAASAVKPRRALEPGGDWPGDFKGVRLGEDQLVQGQAEWNGLYDASATFGVGQDDQNVYLLIRVLDDRVVVRSGEDALKNDAVELFFDLRPLSDRGQPFYDDRCFSLTAAPGRFGAPAQLLDPDGERTHFRGLEVTSSRHFRGYTLLVTLPRAALKELAGEEVTSFGFDLTLHDADWTDQRDVALIWSGGLDNPISPRAFGEVSLTEVEQGTVRVGVF